MWNIYWGNSVIHQPEVEDRRVQHGKLEMSVTSAGCLTFDISPAHALYDEMLGSVRSTKPIIVLRDNVEVFRGRVLSVERDVLVPVAKVTIEGELAALNDTVTMLWKRDGEIQSTETGILAMIIESHNRHGLKFEMGYLGSTGYNPESPQDKYNQYKLYDRPYGTLDLLRLLFGEDVWMRCRRVDDTRYLDVGYRRETGTQELRLGLNLLSMSETIDASEMVTAFYPYISNAYNEVYDSEGRKVADNANVVNLESYKGSIKATGLNLKLRDGYVYDVDLVSKYGWIAEPLDIHDLSSAAGLLDETRYATAQKSLAYISGKYAATVFADTPQSLRLTAVDLTEAGAGYEGITALRVWQTVTVRADDITAQMAITSVTYDLDDPSNDTYEFSQRGTYTKRAATGNIDFVTNNKIDRALITADDAASAAGEKRRVFTSQPVPPYDEGDLWTNTNGDIKVCTTAKALGEAFASADWVNAADWTNDDLARTKNSTYLEDLPPAGTDYSVGDLWFDTDDDLKRYRWTGQAWLLADGLRTVPQDAPVYTDGIVWDSVSTAASSFYVPAEAANSLELMVGGGLITESFDGYDSTGAATTGRWPCMASPTWSEFAMLFGVLPESVSITGMENGSPKTVTFDIPGPDQSDRDNRLRASYETGADGTPLLSDELCLTRTQGAYTLHRWGVAYPSMDLDSWIAGTGPFKVNGYMCQDSDGRRMPYIEGMLPMLRQGWNNALAPTWAYDSTGASGYSLVSTFAHPQEITYYEREAYDEQGTALGVTTGVLALTSRYDLTRQTNWGLRLSGGYSDDADWADALNNWMFADIFADEATKLWAVYYPMVDAPAAEIVDSRWAWPALPPEPLNTSGYLVEVTYPTGAAACTRRITARWDSGMTMAEYLASAGTEYLTDAEIDAIIGS